MTTKFLLLLGPSGVGKSSIIKRLKVLDDRFTYISPYVTRRLREGEKDKVSVSDKALDKLVRAGKILTVNELYGIRYATPREPIEQAFADEKFPVLDWPIAKIEVMKGTFPGQTFRVYIEVADRETLRSRLVDGRDPDNTRFNAGLVELDALKNGAYDNLIDYRILNSAGKVNRVARMVYTQYLSAIGERNAPRGP